jgi:hypothetical protein
MSSITNPKRYTFPQDTYYLTRKAFFGAGSELQVYYSAGKSQFRSSGLGEFWAKGRKVMQLVDGGIDVIGKLYLNGVELSSTPGSSTSVAWADVTGKPSTFAPSAHTHDDRYYTETEFNAWFELTGSAPNQYLRAKFPFACDYEIQAWSDTGWLPPSIWDSLPIATVSSLGGIIVGANLTIDVNGVLNASVAGGAGTWGSIGGTLTDQTDLVTALGLKSDTTHNHTGVYQPVHANLTSLAGLSYAATAFVKMTAANTFALDTAVYITAAGNVTLTNKTINASDNTITDTSTSLGDLLKSNGTKFIRMPRGTAGQMLRTNAAATDVEWSVYREVLEAATGLNPLPTLSIPAGILNITGSHTAWFEGVPYIKTTQTVNLTASANGIWYVFYNSIGTLVVQPTPWTIVGGVPICIVYKNGSSYRIFDERHGTNMSSATHEYLHLTRGTAYISGLNVTMANTSINMGGGSYVDEDIYYTITSANPYQVSILYRDASLNWLWTALQNSWWKAGAGGRPQYDNGGTLAELSSNQFGVYYLVATNDVASPIVSLMGQASYGTLAAARAAAYTSLTLGSLPTPEFKVLYKVIVNATASSGTFQEVQDLRSNPQLVGGAPVLTDHGSLAGLTDDDHIQYALLAGRTGDVLKMDTINEVTSAAGVTVDGLVIKDSGVNFANFSILQESGKLVIKYGSTVIASFSSAGYFKALDEVEAFGTP